MAINRLNPDYPDAGLVQLMPSSVAVGSGSSTVNGNGQVSFSGASSVSLNDVFNGTYDNYKIIYHSTTSASVVVNMRLRVGGADDSTTNYSRAIFLVRSNGSTGEHNSGTGQTAFRVNSSNTSDETSVSLDVYNPNKVLKTGVTMLCQFSDGTSFAGLYGAQSFVSTTVFTGFTIFPASGTFTGTISIYGYRN